MENLTLRLRWIASRLHDTLGLAGLAAALLAAGCLVYAELALRPKQQQLAALAAVPVAASSQAGKPVEAPTQAFLRAFPAPEALAADLQQVFDIAEGYGLAIDEVSYKSQRRPGEPLQRTLMDFSVAAPYPEVRAFLLEALQAQPYLALEQLALRRDSVEAGDVEARIRLALYRRAP